MRTMPAPNCEWGQKDLKRLNAEPWMIEALSLNPDYCSWGPHEDYMSGKGKGWGSPQFLDSWKDFDWSLDDLNECVHFYFGVERENKECHVCEGSGYHPEAQWVTKSFYRHSSPFSRNLWPSEALFEKYGEPFLKFCEEMRELGC